MNFLKTSICAATAALAFALPALADNTGLAVTGTLAFGPNGSGGGQFWVPQGSVIGAGIEYSYVDSANQDTADFSATQLTIRDVIAAGNSASGWEMTFATPGGFTGMTLVSSNFAGLTYSLNGGTIVVDWSGLGGSGYRKPLRDFSVVFDVTAVPEPETYALMLAGLVAVGFVAQRRKA